MKEIRSYFGTALVAVRTSLGVSQYRLAQLTQLSEKYLNLLEHGAYDPRASTILKIARALRISAGVLLDEQERLEALAREKCAPVQAGKESPATGDEKADKRTKTRKPAKQGKPS